jgi:RNase P/RNase MRP subunit p29
MDEAELMRRIQLRASEMGLRLFRNNIGIGWVGKTIRTPQGIVIKNPRPLHSGLANGSGDLIGWTPVKITESHIGKIFAVFTNCECKSPSGRGRVSADQKNFHRVVTESGGSSCIVKSMDEFEFYINEFQKK